MLSSFLFSSLDQGKQEGTQSHLLDPLAFTTLSIHNNTQVKGEATKA